MATEEKCINWMNPLHKSLEIALIDRGFTYRDTRNRYLSDLLGRSIRFLDDLTETEAPKAIEDLLPAMPPNEGEDDELDDELDDDESEEDDWQRYSRELADLPLEDDYGEESDADSICNDGGCGDDLD